MTLVIAGSMTINPDQRDRFVAAATAVVTTTRLEEGNVRYDFSFDIIDANILYIGEEWESQAALDAHLKSAHIAEFRAALAGTVSGRGVFMQYEVSSAAPMG